MNTILVIDDEPAILELFVAFFEGADMTVHTAENGRRAEAVMAEHEPDLIITDIIMPDREGIETIQHIRESFPEMKIITMSGMNNELYLQASKLLGADLSVTKPINFPALKSQVIELLATKTSSC